MFGKKKAEPIKEEKNALVTFVNDKFTEYRKKKLPFELQFRLNIAFIKGDQFQKIDNFSQNIEEIPSFANFEEREIFNKLAPTIETRLSKLARTDVALKVRPATSESKDISSAKVEMKLLESIADKEKISNKQLVANIWSEKTGTCIWKITWNPNKGKIIGYMEDKSSLPDEEKAKSYKRAIREGDVSIDTISPFEIYFEDNYSKKNRRCIHAKVYDIDEVFEIYGMNVKGEDNYVFSLKPTNVGSIGQKGTAYTISNAKKENSVLVLEFWELPSRKYPEGRFIVCTENKLIYEGKLPFMLGEDEGEYELPFIVQESIMTENTVWGDCIYTRLIPIQRRYNSVRNRKKEYLNRVAIGNMTAEEGSLDENLIDEGLEPGQVVFYRRGYQPPTFMRNNDLPSAFDTEKADCDTDLIQISGISEISRDANVPTGVGSGIAINLLREADDGRIAFSAINIQNCRIDIGKKVLILYKQFVDMPRMIRSVGKNNTVEVVEYNSSDITSFDIYIEASSKLAETPAQRRQFVTELLQYGLFNDAETGTISKLGQQKVFEMLELGNWEHFDDDENLHMQKAKRENTYMLEGSLPPVKQFDDDMAHIDEHNKFRLTSDYEEMIATSPQLDQVIEQHVQMHFMNLQQKTMASQPVEQPQ